jgi:hypothetical protein
MIIQGRMHDTQFGTGTQLGYGNVRIMQILRLVKSSLDKTVD